MELSLRAAGGVLRVDVTGRETAEETRAIADVVFAERQRTGLLAVLIRIRESRTIFKVEAYGLSEILERIAAVPGLRVAALTDDAALHAAHQYIEVLARQRGVPYRAFRSEAQALAWLRAGDMPA